MDIEVDLMEVGRAHLASRGYEPTDRGIQPMILRPGGDRNSGWVVQRRRPEAPTLHEFMQDEGVPGQRPWASLYNAKQFWSWREAQNAIRLQGDGGMAVRLKSLETPERPLVPSSTLTIGELGL
jgi:hypothetical protein